MTHLIIHRALFFLRWIGLWVAIGSLLSLSTWNALAQEPTPIPTATPADTPTPTLVPATPTPPLSEPSPTPTNVNTPAVARLIAFRVDEDEIIKGHCALFTWVVKGGVGFVEFDIRDDGKDPYLVSEEGEREECPLQETEYQLLITWLDGSKEVSEVIEIEVVSSGEENSASGSGTPAPTAGAFVVITPISVQPVPGGAATPTGALGAVTLLPETGFLESANIGSRNPVSKKETRFLDFSLPWFYWSNIIVTERLPQ